MKELTRSVRAHLLAGYVTALLLLGVTAIGAVTATGTVSREFVQAVQTDTPLMQDVRLSIKLMDDEETGLRGYLLTHDTSFLTPYTTARRVRPVLHARDARLSAAVPGLQTLLAARRQRAVARRWPEIPLAAVTGYPDDLAELHGRPECPFLVLAKPVRAQQIETVLRLVLQPRPAYRTAETLPTEAALVRS